MDDIPDHELLQARAALWQAVRDAGEQMGLWEQAQAQWRRRIAMLTAEYQRRLRAQAESALLVPRESRVPAARKRRAAGLCSRCRNPRPAGHDRCESCRAYLNAFFKRRRARLAGALSTTPCDCGCGKWLTRLQVDRGQRYVSRQCGYDARRRIACVTDLDGEEQRS